MPRAAAIPAQRAAVASRGNFHDSLAPARRAISASHRCAIVGDRISRTASRLDGAFRFVNADLQVAGFVQQAYHG